MNWSPEQVAIFQWFERGLYVPQIRPHGNTNLEVKARAGTGKTTTIKEAFRHAPENRILYAVFNKKNQIEASSKIDDSRVDVLTLHSLGYRIIKRNWSNAKPDNDVELDRVVSALRGVGYFQDDEALVGLFVKLVGFAKNTVINPTQDDLRKVASEFDLDFDGLQFDWTLAALNAINAAKTRDAAGRISFDDMVWLPVAQGWVKPQYDLVCIDEAQDMNLPQLLMARASSRGRVVVVGDDRQAIYGFRGAAQGGMGMMKALLRADSLTLTVTYRCPKAVVAEAAKIVPDYKAADEAPEGVVAVADQVAMLARLKVGDAILSRLNAPLFPLALNLVRRNIPARIEGRDIGKQLVGMIRSLKATSVPQFVEKVEAWLSKQTERLMKAKNAEKKLEQANDIAETLKALAQAASSVRDIEARLDNLFGGVYVNAAAAEKVDAKPVVLLSSVHKAKGLEWPNVYLLSETFRQAKGGEEANIYYVAVTRAQRELVFVSGAAVKTPESALSASNPPAVVEAPKAPESAPEPPKGTAVPASVAEGDFARKFAGATGSEWESPLPGQVWLTPGIVFAHNGAEYVSVRLGDCNALCAPLTKTSRTIKYRGKGLEDCEKTIESFGREIKASRQIDASAVIRRMTEQELNDFLSGVGPEETTNNNPDTKGTDSMAKTKTKKAKGSGAKTNSGITGAAEFVRKAYAEGATKAETREKVLQKWPKFEHDAAGFESRWKTAERLAKAADAKAKAAAKAPAKKKTEKPAKKAPAKAKSSTPPPRPAKPATTEPAPAAPATEAAPTTEATATEPKEPLPA